jgi:hypothetical protein
MAREYEINPDDEREVDLSDDVDPLIPPTLDADERVEDTTVDDDPEVESGDGPLQP